MKTPKIYQMKKLILLIIPIFVFSCMASSNESGELPEDFGALQKMQKNAKDEIKQLNERLVDIEQKMREVAPEKFERDAKLITTMPLERSTFIKYADIQGELDIKNELNISSETGGRLITMDLEEGQYVRKGQQVAELDMESVKKQKAEIEKSLELARDIYERRKHLIEQNIGSEVEYLQAKNQVERLEKSIETLDHQLTKSKVYAPISGEVFRVMREAGEVVAPGEPFAMILDPGMLKAVAFVPERYLTSVKRGDSVTVLIPALKMEKRMKVSRVGAKINPQNRTFEVEVDIPNRDGVLKPNLLTKMLIEENVQENVIVLPANFVQQEVSGRYFVYTLKESGDELVAEKKYVKTGQSYNSKVVITEGLTEDDILIDEGSRNVSAGEAVRIVEALDQSNLSKK